MEVVEAFYLRVGNNVFMIDPEHIEGNGGLCSRRRIKKYKVSGCPGLLGTHTRRGKSTLIFDPSRIKGKPIRSSERIRIVLLRIEDVVIGVVATEFENNTRHPEYLDVAKRRGWKVLECHELIDPLSEWVRKTAHVTK